MVLNWPGFQRRTEPGQRQPGSAIYPVIGKGPVPGTSDLDLIVKDRLPLHAKTELNNQSSPGTPELRVNSSAVYNNLWQLEHSLGIQYGFSPEEYKSGNQWDFYDEPQVANYSGFYRLPLGGPSRLKNGLRPIPGALATMRPPGSSTCRPLPDKRT